MICPNCQAANPETARFCMNCGYALAPTANCPSCGSPVLPGANFCFNCGKPLAAANPFMQGQLQKFIPRELLDKLQSARSAGTLDGERRVVTMLFCDVKGSTAMAEKLDPEEWAEIMNGAFEYLIPPVFRYEGMIPRMMGDAILAFFGAPIAHEDDPERAVRAGLEMVAGIQEYHQELRRERGLDFEVRVGINTGLVVVGQVGTNLRLEYTAMGDAINLAARMEQTAEPGTVQISEHTYRLVDGLFEVEPLGGIEVKGKSKPVDAYRVLRPIVVSTRLTWIDRLAIPLVGREKEMAALRRKVAEVRQGRGSIVCLIGEAGLGKTRLIAELQREWEQGSPPGPAGDWDVVSSTSFAAGRPYGQFRQHLLEHMEIGESDPAEIVREKIHRMYVNEFAGLRDQAVSVYSLLLGIEVPGTGKQGSDPALPLEGEAFERELYELVLSFERIWLGEGPGVQVFDDLHWSDPASTGLLTHLFQLVQERPILFLCAFRPEPDSPVWSLKQAAETKYGDRYTEIRLNPLLPEDSKTLINHLLSSVAPPTRGFEQVIEQILLKADGNPLFIEEVVRDLLERGKVQRDSDGLRWKGNGAPGEFTIPGSLQALLVARLDRLEEDTHRTLQLASVIGRSFYYKVLKRISDAALRLDQDLQNLQGNDLIREASRYPELEFEFRHALTQEAAYHSILVKRRREYHRRVAEALESLFSDRLENHAALLAHHFAAAEDSRARRYFHLAGKQAAQIYANDEALAYYSRALEIPGAETEETIAVQEARGEIYFSRGQFEQASADFEGALELARQAGRTEDESRLLADLAWLRWSSGKGAEALELARAAESGSRTSGDPAQVLHATIILGTATMNLGDLRGARSKLQQALFASPGKGRRRGMRRARAFSLYSLAILENFAGRFGRAVICARAAREIFLQLGDRRMACGSLFYQSLAEGGLGRYDQALATLEAGRLLADEISSLWSARYPNQRAWLSAELGDWATAYTFDRAGLQPAQSVPGFREIEISTLINLVLDCIAMGRLAEAETYLAEAKKDLGRPEFGSHNWRWSIRLADAQARLALARKEFKEAARPIASLLDQAKRLEARKYTVRGLVLAGRVHQAVGAYPEAEANLLTACHLADSLCYPPAQIESRLLLSDLYRQINSNDLAEKNDLQAVGLLVSLDEQIQHPELRLSFERGIGKALKSNC